MTSISRLLLSYLLSSVLLVTYLLVMLLTVSGYLIKLGVDTLLAEVVTLFANLGKKIGMQ